MQTMMLAWGGAPGWLEILLVLLLLVILFGARRLPELARSLGKSLSEFKKGRREGAGEADAPPAPDPKRDNGPDA